MTSTILHLSASDISHDSRILKAINVGENCNFIVNYVGLADRSAENFVSSSESRILVNPNIRNYSLIPILIQRFVILVQFYVICLKTILKVNPTIIHCHDVLPLPAVILSKLFRQFKVIYDAHELESNKNYQSRLGGKLIFVLERILLPYCNHLITVSPSIKLWYRNELYDGPITVILNSPVIQAKVQNGAKYTLRDILEIPPSQKIFIYVGMLIKGRGIDLILQAFQKANLDASIVFLGDGELKSDILNASKKNTNIYWLPPVPHQEVVELISSADIGVCLIENVSLSDYFSLPNKLFEMTFAGLRVIASNFPDIRDYLDKTGLGTLTNLEINETVAAFIAEAKNSSDFGKSNDALMNYSWQNQSSKLAEIYRNLRN